MVPNLFVLIGANIFPCDYNLTDTMNINHFPGLRGRYYLTGAETESSMLPGNRVCR